MAFEKVQNLDPTEVISLGGISKKTGKKNPSQIEGYYLGSREVPDKKKKSGKSYIHVFQTPKGNVGVWGKTNLDRQIASATPGFMMRVTQEGTKETENGSMYLYTLEVDKANSIDVVLQGGAGSQNGGGAPDADEDETALDDDYAADEVVTSRAAAPKEAAQVDAAKAARVNALLNGNRAR